MRLNLKPMVIMFFIIYIFAWSLTTCSFVKADELNCETFVNEKICKMTPAEQEKWFWELFRSLIEEEKQEIVETIDV